MGKNGGLRLKIEKFEQEFKSKNEKILIEREILKKFDGS